MTIFFAKIINNYKSINIFAEHLYQVLDRALYVPMFVVTEFIHGIRLRYYKKCKNKTTLILISANLYRDARDSKRSGITEKSCYYYSFNML